ncbi:MAG: hypothetical protein MPJ24_08815 [Pirellulaceae bacterium]|nr:hypothetical protein [Pirellulaceae bacterium]
MATLFTTDTDEKNGRIQLTHCHENNGESMLRIEQQSWAQEIGWFTQKSIDLDPSQLKQIRNFLQTNDLEAINQNRPTLTFSPKKTKKTAEDQAYIIPFPTIATA